MSSHIEFTSLPRQKRLSSVAADHIAQMIADNQLQTGEKLPSERQLGEMFGVSRTVVREAIKLLEARRLLDSGAGGGTVVLGAGPGPVTESIQFLLRSDGFGASFDDVQAVRNLLEVGTAIQAAKCATQDDLDLLQDAFERMVNAQTIAEQMQADYDFHLTIAKATHNQVFVLLLQALNDVVRQIWRDYWQARARIDNDISQTLTEKESESNEYHLQLLQAIKNRDTEGARKAMSQLLSQWADMYGEMLGGSRATETQ